MDLAVTGHRLNRLGYQDWVEGRLKDLARVALQKYQPAQVLTGMALGWDMAVAAAAAELKVPFVAVVPFEGQDSFWPDETRLHYTRLLSKATRVEVVVPGRLTPEQKKTAFKVRNVYLVEHCDVLLALWDGTRSGTGHCVEVAGALQRKTVNLWASWRQYSKR